MWKEKIKWHFLICRWSAAQWMNLFSGSSLFSLANEASAVYWCPPVMALLGAARLREGRVNTIRPRTRLPWGEVTQDLAVTLSGRCCGITRGGSVCLGRISVSFFLCFPEGDERRNKQSSVVCGTSHLFLKQKNKTPVAQDGWCQIDMGSYTKTSWDCQTVSVYVSGCGCWSPGTQWWLSKKCAAAHSDQNTFTCILRLSL